MTAEQEKLVTENMRLVMYIYQNKLLKSNFVFRHQDDLISEGYIGLIKAAIYFNPNRNCQFATLATRCILNQMLMYIRRQKKHNKVISLDAEICPEIFRSDTIADDKDYIAEVDEAMYATPFLKKLNPTQKEIVKQVTAGKTQKEIALSIGLSQTYIGRLIRGMRKKYRGSK
jgi:RNA polymerase sporulation-specific sigma factor